MVVALDSNPFAHSRAAPDRCASPHPEMPESRCQTQSARGMGYTAFGETYAPRTSTTVEQRYTYTGREQSPLAGSGAPMFYRYRNYFPGIGRFGARDLGTYYANPRGNLYDYASANPILYLDSFGLETHVCMWIKDQIRKAIDDHDKAEKKLKDLKEEEADLLNDLGWLIWDEQVLRNDIEGIEATLGKYGWTGPALDAALTGGAFLGATEVAGAAGVSSTGAGAVAVGGGVLHVILLFERLEFKKSGLALALGQQAKTNMELHGNRILQEEAKGEHDEAAERRDMYREQCEDVGCCDCP
jgi:RHS repeat-associated protein